MRSDGLLFSLPRFQVAARGPRYQRLYPPHRVYVDLFGGSAAMIARQPPRTTSRSITTSTSERVQRVRDCEGLALQRYSSCWRARRMTGSNTRCAGESWPIPVSPVSEKHGPFIVCGTIGFSAHPALANGCTRYEHRCRALRTLPGKLHWWHKRLQPVHLENRTWQEIVEQYDSPDTFFFCDPPYLPGVLRKACKYYQHDMDAAAHVELIERLRKIKGRCLICGYHHPLYTQLLFHWRRITFVARESMGSRTGKRKEVVWLNYESDGSKIEGNRLRIARSVHQDHGR